jgi:hypothetical protein
MLMFSLTNTTTDIVSSWYSWGVAIAFAITFVTTLWIFFDSQSNAFRASFWRWLSLLAAIVVIPSVILSFSPQLATGLPPSIIKVLAFLGILSTITALFSLLLYGLGVGVDTISEENAPTTSDSVSIFTNPNDGFPTAVNLTPTPTPPHGVQPTTKEKPVASQHVPLTDSNTIRIKNIRENELPLAWIVILNGPHAGYEHRLQRITDVGREQEHNDIALEDRTISRQHARIRYEKGAYVLYDLASANGVFINGEQIRRRVLAHGDRIKIGQVMLGVLIVDEELNELSARVTTQKEIETSMD